MLDNVLVTFFRSPNSYTGEDSAEISCLASPYIASRILSLIVDAGASTAGPGVLTRRAF
ncbi:MAG: tRNA uridine-5-carboxymethylaminomethyl(34) synthesis GTPase MnmE, partial [Bacteroidales bacterium]|nr:tRNA uridine-5-carboxymethylaminomethyl(34) synthesis GTPase MnmE [Bacteroidales bacterium]